MEDNRKFIILSIVGVAAVTAEVLFKILGIFVELFHLSTINFVGGLSWDIAGRIFAYALLAIASVISYRHPKLFSFLNEVCNEMRKVTWPIPKETAASTVVVVIVVLIVSMILFLYDWLWSSIFQNVL